jgi:hypothetical protein
MSERRRLPFYLMQRMTAEDRPGRPGIDGLFSLDYMGAAEFEWGAIPDSLKAMRGQRRRLVIESLNVSREGVTRPVYFVGGRDDVAAAMAEFPAWFAEDYPHGKEWSYLPENFTGTANEWQQRTNAWWALRGNVMLALDPVIAERLRDGVKGKGRNVA